MDKIISVLNKTTDIFRAITGRRVGTTGASCGGTGHVWIKCPILTTRCGRWDRKFDQTIGK